MVDNEVVESPQVESLQEELREKEALVLALTSQLEEAAEQLDRLRRTGSDRGGRGGGGLPSELIEQQQSLVENLSRVVDDWEQQQPAVRLERLERRILELHDLLEQGVPRASTTAPADPTAHSNIKASEQINREKEQTGGQSAWEAMKAQLMEQDGASVSAPAASSPAAGSSSPAPSPSAATSDTDQPADEASSETPAQEQEPPVPVDFETAGLHDLRKAVECRESYIAYLVRRLRREEHRTAQTIDWAALNNVPEELRERLRSLEAELDEKLRIAEVDLSLERARLSRVQANVEAAQQKIERRLKQTVGKQSRFSELEDGKQAKAEPSQTGWFKRRRK